MTVSNRVPASGLTLNFAEQFSFEVTDGYASLLVRVTTEGGVLESVYDSGDGGAAPGYTVSVEDLGATVQLVCTRDSGWSIDPTQVHVTEDGVTTSWSYDIFPTREYPEGMQPYNDPDASAITATVDSWEGRTGNVVAQADDYPASEVTNDSGVTGAYVDDALDKLATDIAAIPVPNYPVDTVHARTGDVVSVKGDYTGSEVTVAVLGTPDIDTVQEVIDHTLGVGHISGGDFTDNGDGTIIVGAGTGFIRAIDGDTEPVYSMGWTEVPAQALTDNSINFVYVEYNAGTPQVAVSTVLPTDLNTNLLLWSVYRSGNFLHQTPNRYDESNLAREVNRRLYNVDGTTHATGAAIADAGTLHFDITAGTFYLGLNVAEWAAQDTSVSDTFLDFYSDGASGWTVSSGNSVIDNTYYDDGSGTLAALSANRYGVHWVYISPHDQDMYVVYGTGNYTRTQAEQALAPSVLPPHIDYWHGVLAGKIIVNESATELFSVESAFVKLFLSGGVADHGDLTGLADDDHTLYSLVDGTRAFTGAIEIDSATAGLTVGEHSSSMGTPAAGKVAVYAKADGLMYSKDDAGVETLMSSGLGGGGSYVTTDGTTPQDAAFITHRAAKVNVTTATECELWARTAGTYDEPMWTGSGGLDWSILRAYNPVDRTIPFWTVAAAGDYCTVDANFVYNNSTDELIMEGSPALALGERATAPTNVVGQGKFWVENTAPTRPMFSDDAAQDSQVMLLQETDPANDGDIPMWDNTLKRWRVEGTDILAMQSNELKHLGTNAVYTQAERSSAPGSAAGRGKWWVSNSAPCKPYFTDDESRDLRLGMQRVVTTCTIAPTTVNTWYSSTNTGPHNDTAWSSTYGTSSFPSTAGWHYPGLFHTTGLTRIVRVRTIIRHPTDVTMDFELTGSPQIDFQAAASTYDPIVDSSINGSWATGSGGAKLTVRDHTINDPYVANNVAVMAFFRRTAGSSSTFYLTLQIDYETYGVHTL